jgi:hypothetical protein
MEEHLILRIPASAAPRFLAADEKTSAICKV